MDFYNVHEQTMFPNGPIMLDNFDHFFTDRMLNSMLDNNMYDTGHLKHPEDNCPPTQNLIYTEVFRASDMNTAKPCANGIQHLPSSPSSSPITPGASHDDHADMDSDCTSCVKCRETATQKRARRREQNRQSQRKFRAKKEAKLSDARARIRDLEALIRAQEKTNIELKLIIEKLNSRESRMDTNARRNARLSAEKSTSTHVGEMTNPWNGATDSGTDSSDSLPAAVYDHELLPPQECRRKK